MTGTREHCISSSGLNAPYGAPCFLTRAPRPSTHNHPSKSQCTLWRSMLSDGSHCPYCGSICCWSQCTLWRSMLSDPAGLVCMSSIMASCLNAPYGAPCFLTARRVAPAVTGGNDTSDRQGPKKHESDPQARRQISRLFVAILCIATDVRQHSSRPGNSRSRRRVAPLHACTTPHAKQPNNRAQTRTPPTRPIPHTEAGTHRAVQRDGPRPRDGARTP